MIGSGLKKLAKENNMKVASGVAYGVLRGYAVTLWEGAGYKAVAVAANFADPARKQQMMDTVGQVNMTKEYRVQNFGVAPRSIQVVFADNPGTMKKITAFIDWFFPILDQFDAAGANLCPECGCEITGGKWVLIEGIAYHMHESCAEKTLQSIEAENTRQTEERNGSYLTGFLGALCGSAIGAVLWAIVLNLGYVASLVGLVIGWLAEKGYNLFRGKQGRAKVAILILVVIIGVLLGTFAADAFTLIGMINEGDLPGFTLGEVPVLILALLAEDEGYRSAVMSNILMGLLFAALGVFGILHKAGKEVAGTKAKYLE